MCEVISGRLSGGAAATGPEHASGLCLKLFEHEVRWKAEKLVSFARSHTVCRGDCGMWSMQLRTAESSCEQKNSVLQRDERCQGHTTLTSQHMSSLKPSFWHLHVIQSVPVASSTPGSVG